MALPLRLSVMADGPRIHSNRELMLEQTSDSAESWAV